MSMEVRKHNKVFTCNTTNANNEYAAREHNENLINIMCFFESVERGDKIV